MKRMRKWSFLIPGILLMILLFIVPLVILFRYSFYLYQPGQLIQPAWTIDSYKRVLTDSFYQKVLWESLWIGGKVVFFTFLLGYPLAYMLARTKVKFRRMAAIIVILPLLTSGVVTTFGWMTLLSDSGVINTLLQKYELIEKPIRFMFSDTGVMIALIQELLPFMVISIRSTLLNQDGALEDAASTLGAPPIATFFRVTLPLSLPGVFAGSLLVFIGTISAFVTVILLGGGRIQTLASVIYNEMMTTLNWPLAAAASMVLLVVTSILLWGYKKIMESRLLGGGGRS